MSIYTPRGLRIQLSHEYCWALVARLGPNGSAEEVFRTAEALDAFPWALSFLAGLVSVSAGGTWWLVMGAVALGAPVGFLLLSAGAARVPWVRRLGDLYRTAWWYGVPLSVVLVGLTVLAGWRATAAYVTGWAAARLSAAGIDRLECRRLAALHGLPLRGADRSMALAYRLHARRLGRPDDLWPSHEDYEPRRIDQIYRRFADRHPGALQKFT